MQENGQKGYCPLASLGRDRGFLCRDIASGSVSRHGSLCRDAVPKLQAVARSRQGFPGHDRVVFLSFFCRDKGFPCRDRVVFLPFFCRDSVLFYVVTMSQYRFPCRDRDGRGKRSGLRQELG